MLSLITNELNQILMQNNSEYCKGDTYGVKSSSMCINFTLYIAMHVLS